MRAVAGFTLVEIMIVLVILFVLLLVALPRYGEQVHKTQRVLARAELQKVALRQEQYFTEQRAYATNLAELGYPGDRYVLSRDGEARAWPEGRGIYLITMEADRGAYRVAAAPLRVDSRCGTLSLDGLGIRGAGGPGGVASCW